MKIGIIGAGNIGGNLARQAVRVGHEVIVSYSRHPAALDTFAAELGDRASVATTRHAVTEAEITVIAVPWSVLPDALAQAGPLSGAVIIDTTNHFGAGDGPGPGQTAAAFNAARMPGARYVKCFNTLTARFQADTALRAGGARVVQWLCGDDRQAKDLVAGFVDSLGYQPVDLGGTADCAVMESPRRPGAVYGEEYRLVDARAVVEAVRGRRAIPDRPVY
jgi:predicted dinucleotide-binding enzyme